MCDFFFFFRLFLILIPNTLQLATVPPLLTSNTFAATTNTFHNLDKHNHRPQQDLPSPTSTGNSTSTGVVSTSQVPFDSLTTHLPTTASPQATFVDSYHSPEFCFEQTSATSIPANYMLGSGSLHIKRHQPPLPHPVPGLAPSAPTSANQHHDGEFPRKMCRKLFTPNIHNKINRSYLRFERYWVALHIYVFILLFGIYSF